MGFQLQGIKRVVLWQNMPSHHQAGYISELVKHDLDVVWIVQSPITGTARGDMGWPEFTSSEVELIVSPNRDQIIEALEKDPETTLHIFGGVFFVPLVRTAFIQAARRGLNLALMSEPPLPIGAASLGEGGPKLRRLPFLMPLLHRTFRFAYGRNIRAVFCIGKMARDWGREMGYPDEKLFPWAYFPVQPPYPDSPPAPDTLYRMIYMGQLTPRKGVDLMVEAALGLPGDHWRLKIIGQGELLENLQAKVSEAGKSTQIEFLPFSPWAETMQVLAQSDLALVPSRHDGWGAVVSEALMQGVPVICTDRTGAQDLLQHSWRGTIVPAQDSDALQRAMIQWMDRGSPTPEDRARIRAWSKRAQGAAAAEFLASILSHITGKSPRPSAPWFDDEPLPESTTLAP